MRKITVKASVVKRALARAEKLHDDWQAQCLEILLLPNVYKRWRQLNAGRYPDLTVERHKGRRHVGFSRDDNMAVKDWSEIAGYTFGYGLENYVWNRVRKEHYGHSPSTTWDGLQRETRCGFIESLRMLALMAMGEMDTTQHVWASLFDANVEFIDDISPPLFALYKLETWDGKSIWFLRKINLSARRVEREVEINKSRRPIAVLPWHKTRSCPPDEYDAGNLPDTAKLY